MLFSKNVSSNIASAANPSISFLETYSSWALDPRKRSETSWIFWLLGGNFCTCPERWFYGRYIGTLELRSQNSISNFVIIHMAARRLSKKMYKESKNQKFTKSPKNTKYELCKLYLLHVFYSLRFSQHFESVLAFLVFL